MEEFMEIHESESKSVRASGYSNEKGKFIILKGSYAVIDKVVQLSLGEKPKRVSLRKELIATGKIVDVGEKYEFIENVIFNSPSEAASIVWGSNLNGRKVFGLGEELLPSYKLYFDIDSKKAIEGYKKDHVLSISGRDRSIITARKEKDNYTCQACSLRIKVNNKYVIECHHLNPIHLGKRETSIEELISLCPTCHRIVHMREPLYSITEIREIIASNN